MKIRRLGFDLDDVIADTSSALLQYAKEEHGVELTEEQRKHYKLEEMPGLDPWIAADVYKQVLDPAFFMDVKPVEGAKDVLRFLKRKGRRINIITARPEDNFSFTSKWLKQNGLWYNTLTCCSSSLKPRMAAELKLETFVDDRFDILMEFVNFRQSGRWKKLGVMHRDWNAGMYHERITRVRTWEDIVGLLEVKGRK